MALPGRTPRRGRDERGVVIVLTSIAMIAMISFTALAIDLGMRDQYLARDQHAIDSATLAASYELKQLNLTITDRLDRASARAKELIEENIGTGVVDWHNCKDAEHDTIAASDAAIGNECISFSRDGDDDIVKIKLPDHSMKTIFGGVIGVDKVNISAIANSDGSSCVVVQNPQTCGSALTTTTAPAGPTTTVPWADWCPGLGHDIWFYAYEWTYNNCNLYWHSTLDVHAWLLQFCQVRVKDSPPGAKGYETHLLTMNQSTMGAPDWHFDITAKDLYTVYDNCWNLPGFDDPGGPRDNWLATYCPTQTYNMDQDSFDACMYWYEDHGMSNSQYGSTHGTTTTTTAPPSATTTPTTPPSTAPTTTAPDNIDIRG